MRPKKHILCVDSDILAGNVRSCLLQTRGNYLVTQATSSVEALFALRRRRFDLLLSNAVIETDCSGEALARGAKKLDPGLPVLLISPALRRTELILEYADGFLGKECCGSLDLLERVRTMIARKRGPKKHAQPVPIAEGSVTVECAG